MNKRKFFSNILITFIVLCLFIPYILNIFYFHTLDFYIILIFDSAAAVLIALFIILYFFVERRKYFRIVIPLIIFVATLSFFISYNVQMSAADYVFFKLREKKLNEFVYQVKQYNEITEMSDAKANHGSLNDSLFSFDREHLSKDGKGYTNLYSDLIRDMQIDESVHKEFIKKLKEVDCTKFQTYTDGAVCFTIKSGLGQSVGITYSPSGEKHIFYGTAKKWEHLSGDWYFWSN